MAIREDHPSSYPMRGNLEYPKDVKVSLGLDDILKYLGIRDI